MNGIMNVNTLPRERDKETRAFWDSNPCDGYVSIHDRMAFRYRKEPFLPPILATLAKEREILEIGCGQGTDALSICRLMNPVSTYVAIDLSPGSIKSARQSCLELKSLLHVLPRFMVANSSALPFKNHSFESVVSLGVLHHADDTRQGIREAFRVLKPGGKAFLSLYRSISPKLLVARFLRRLSEIVDRALGQDRFLYSCLRERGPTSKILGTMLLECFGVPILRSYSRCELARLMAPFNVKSMTPVGMGFPFFGFNHLIDTGPNILGAQWYLIAEKPAIAQGATHGPASP